MSNPYQDTAAANRYDAARDLLPQTKTAWMTALQAAIPASNIRAILDLGCGTGRFTESLATSFACPVTGIEPSAAMLDVAKSRDTSTLPHVITWKQGSAEQIPLEAHSVDLIFMSQIVHHLVDPHIALQEIDRVLYPGGYLAIRNGTKESDSEIPWLYCFPEANEIGGKRTPTRQNIIDWITTRNYALLSQQSIRQYFTSSYEECYGKVSGRGLSALIAISDEAFERGLGRLRDWVAQQPPDEPVYEAVDLFIFRKQ
jgi:ubiquinone/menaquinone biosynthesis C-methylase UbiE